jgi:hypothetical protein
MWYAMLDAQRRPMLTIAGGALARCGDERAMPAAGSGAGDWLCRSTCAFEHAPTVKLDRLPMNGYLAGPA